MSSFLAVRVSDRALPAHLRISLSKETIGGEIVDRDRDHEPVDSRGIAALAHRCCPWLQDVVCQERFLDISACAEQLAGRRETSRELRRRFAGAENRELRAERGEQSDGHDPVADDRDGRRSCGRGVPEGRLAPIRTPIGSEPEKATMQLLHQT